MVISLQIRFINVFVFIKMVGHLTINKTLKLVFYRKTMKAVLDSQVLDSTCVFSFNRNM